jgi:hypothetical protein
VNIENKWKINCKRFFIFLFFSKQLIYFWNNRDISNEYDIGSQEAAYNQKSGRYNGNSNFNSTISGKANRIGAFKKSIALDGKEKSRDRDSGIPTLK